MSISFCILYPILGQQLIIQRHLNMLQVTFLLNLRLIVQDVGMLYGGIFCSNFGSRLGISISAMVRGIGFLLYGVSPNLWILSLASILSGLGGSFFFPSILQYYTHNSSEEDIGQMLALKSALDATGSIVGPLIGMWLIKFGFLNTSLISSLIFILCGIIAYFCLPKDHLKVHFADKNPQIKSLVYLAKNKPFIFVASIISVIMLLVNSEAVALTAKINMIEPEYPYISAFSVVGALILILFQVPIYSRVSVKLATRTIVEISIVLFVSGYLIFGYAENIVTLYIAIITIYFAKLFFLPSRELLLVKICNGQQVGIYYGFLGVLQSILHLVFTPFIGTLLELSQTKIYPMLAWYVFAVIGLLALLIMNIKFIRKII